MFNDFLRVRWSWVWLGAWFLFRSFFLNFVLGILRRFWFCGSLSWIIFKLVLVGNIALTAKFCSFVFAFHNWVIAFRARLARLSPSLLEQAFHPPRCRHFSFHSLSFRIFKLLLFGNCSGGVSLDLLFDFLDLAVQGRPWFLGNFSLFRSSLFFGTKVALATYFSLLAFTKSTISHNWIIAHRARLVQHGPSLQKEAADAPGSCFVLFFLFSGAFCFGCLLFRFKSYVIIIALFTLNFSIFTFWNAIRHGVSSSLQCLLTATAVATSSRSSGCSTRSPLKYAINHGKLLPCVLVLLINITLAADFFPLILALHQCITALQAGLVQL